MFMNALENKLNVTVTENGAVGYKTTGKALLDLNFAVSSLRHADETEIINRFYKAFDEDPELAARWLFFARDIRGGLGERRLFKTVMGELAKRNPEYVENFIPLIAEYGRFDDLYCLFDTGAEDKTLSYLSGIISDDLFFKTKGKSVTLLAKWLPSENASSVTSKALAKKIRRALHYTSKGYRKMLSELRGYIDVTETKMSANKWRDIDYEKVPSKANLNYADAFLRHDEQRRREYLDALSKGETKINASTLYPHEIVAKYYTNRWYGNLKDTDAVLENMWTALPQMGSLPNTITVVDGSGSMYSNYAAIPACVAQALAVYFSERCTGQFKNKFITFSRRPQLIDLSGLPTLYSKLNEIKRHDEVANTNIEAVFELVLLTALEYDMPQEELPKNILIISDMEFDGCAENASANLFANIKQKYSAHGYCLPRLVFWNVASRTETIPLKENDRGVCLISGYSQNVCNMILSGKLDPYECLKDQLMDKRYEPVGNAHKAAYNERRLPF